MRAKIFLSVAAFSFTLGFAVPSMAEKIYKWTDEKGQVHYSQENPQDQKATIIESNNKVSGVEGLTPEMNKRLKDLEERAKEAQAAKAQELEEMQTGQKNRNYIPYNTSDEITASGPKGPAVSAPTGPTASGPKGPTASVPTGPMLGPAVRY
ncbi:MAG TPA: DUF4124 domain-containing protein [Acidiferrobacterales bacterium]|nr:DUF4124 domain-containing protein [Acidiferrobacterales bacterium]